MNRMRYKSGKGKWVFIKAWKSPSGRLGRYDSKVVFTTSERVMVVEERKTSPSYLGALQRQIGELAQVRRDNSACGSFQSDSSKKVSFVDVRRSNTVWNEGMIRCRDLIRGKWSYVGSELEIGQATTLWMVVSLTLRLLGFKNRAFSHWTWATELIHHSPYLTPNSNSTFTQHQRANTTPNKSYFKDIQIALFSSYIWPQISKSLNLKG